MPKFTFKNMKKVWGSYKLIILIVLLFLIIIPLLVLAVNNQLNGYDATHGGAPIFLKDLSPLGVTATCITNNSTNDYFVPTKTLNEWNAFVTYHPSGTTVQGCCGDGYCNYTGANTGNKESVVNTGTYSSYTVCIADCSSTPSTACGNGVCDTSYDTHANCPSDCCGTPTDCGSNGCQVATTCTSNVQTCSAYWNNFTCTSGTCGYSSGSATSICGGGENSMCAGTLCTNKCYNQNGGYYSGDDDSDGYADAKDTDCGGCGSLCTSGPGCNSTTNCFLDGASCGSGGTYKNNFCMGNLASCSSCSNPKVCVNGNCENAGTADCPQGYYGTQGNCTKCAAGFYSTAGSVSCLSCPANYQCLYGVKIPCPSGTFNSGGTNTCNPQNGYNGTYS